MYGDVGRGLFEEACDRYILYHFNQFSYDSYTTGAQVAAFNINP